MPDHAFSLNGTTVIVNAPDDLPLLWVLRDMLGITGPKFGCGIDVCKACTSHLDGEAMRALRGPFPRRRGQTRHHDRGPGRRRGAAPGPTGMAGPRCRSVRLLPARPDHGGRGPARPHDRTVHAEIDAIENVCRCGTYVRIREAIRDAAARMRE